MRVGQLNRKIKAEMMSAVQEVEQLRQIGLSIGETFTPLLNAEQQQKFQVMREERRRELIEKMASKEAHKLETDIKQELDKL